MRAVSRCLWDVHTDVAAAVTHESETMYCVCQVIPLVTTCIVSLLKFMVLEAFQVSHK